jgi:hypothetical protein
MKNKTFVEKSNLFMMHMWLIQDCQDLIKVHLKYEDGFCKSRMGVIKEDN